MKRLFAVVLLAILASGCENFYVVQYPGGGHSHGAGSFCDDTEPYYEPAEEYFVYEDHFGYYEGECAVWYVGHGHWEEWCNWQDTCGWEFVDEWYY